MKIDKRTLPAHRGADISAHEAWRLLGIMSEFVEATERLAYVRPAVSIFGSARIRVDSAYYLLAERTARLLSDAGFAVISGGGPGTMEAANKGAYFGAAPSVGLNIELPHEQVPNGYQDISVDFRHFFARKAAFASFACAYVVMPGGMGTLDELFDGLTLVQTGKLERMPILLVNRRYWSGLLDWFRDRVLGEEMITQEDADLIQVVEEPQEVVDAIFSFYDKRGFEGLPGTKRELILDL